MKNEFLNFFLRFFAIFLRFFAIAYWCENSRTFLGSNTLTDAKYCKRSWGKKLFWVTMLPIIGNKAHSDSRSRVSQFPCFNSFSKRFVFSWVSTCFNNIFKKKGHFWNQVMLEPLQQVLYFHVCISHKKLVLFCGRHAQWCIHRNWSNGLAHSDSRSQRFTIFVHKNFGLSDAKFFSLSIQNEAAPT